MSYQEQIEELMKRLAPQDRATVSRISRRIMKIVIDDSHPVQFGILGVSLANATAMDLLRTAKALRKLIGEKPMT